MGFKVTGAPGSGKIKTHIESKKKINAKTGKEEKAVVETPVEDKKKEKK